MDENERASREYMVMNTLVEEGMEPDYTWTLMSEIVLTFPNFIEFEEGCRIIVRDLLMNEEIITTTIRNKRREVWIAFE